MLEEILNRRSIEKALEQVESNKGAEGVDGVKWNELRPYVNTNWKSLRTSVLKGNYKPSPVRKVEIEKPGGGTRKLGIPTVLDRMLEQAVAQWLEPIYEPKFSDKSYGYRPGRNAHQAIQQARQYLNEGKTWIIEMDLAQFFDRVNHDKLMGKLRKEITDKGTLSLIRKFLTCGIMEGGVASTRSEGTPQGSPLAPRTHPRTFRFRGDFRLKEEGFNCCYIKSSIFMKYGTVTELRVSQASQSNLQFIEERNAAFPDCRPVNGDVWNFPDSGISLHPEGSGESGKDPHTGGYCRVHCKTSSQLDQKDQKICAFPGAIYQQSGAYCAGRVPVKEGSWQKRRDKLKCRIATTVCGSKSFLRFTISLSHQLITIIFPQNGPLLN